MAGTIGATSSKTIPVRQERAARADRAYSPLGIFYFSVLVGALIGLVLGHVWLRLQVVHMGYVLSTISKLQSRLEQEHRELKIELATLMSPQRLETLGRNRLGFKPPEKGQVIVLP